MIRVFDVAQPGRSFEARPTCKTRKSKTGQRGIISALAFSPDTSGGGLFAAGSYAKTICLYSANRWADDRQGSHLAAGRRLSLLLLLSLSLNCVARTRLCGGIRTPVPPAIPVCCDSVLEYPHVSPRACMLNLVVDVLSRSWRRQEWAG